MNHLKTKEKKVKYTVTDFKTHKHHNRNQGRLGNIFFSLRELLTGLLGAELILRRSSWMLLASFMSEGCRVKLRFAPGDENRFLAQFSTEERDASALFVLGGHSDLDFSESETRA